MVLSPDLIQQIPTHIKSNNGKRIFKLVQIFQHKFRPGEDDYYSIEKTIECLDAVTIRPESINVYLDSSINSRKVPNFIKIAREGAPYALRGIYDFLEDHKELQDEISSAAKKTLERYSGSAENSSQKSVGTMIKEMNGRVIGQKSVVNELVLAVYEYIHFNIPGVLFVVGPSGCGKTYLAEILAQVSELSCLLLPVSAVTEQGIKGENLDDLLRKIDHFAANQSKGLIILDEFDKLLAPNYDSHGSNRSEAIQAQLMTLFSPGVALEESGRRTNDFLYVLTGAYSTLREAKRDNNSSIGFNCVISKEQTDCQKLAMRDLKEYGLTSELARRITSIYQIHALSENDVYQIAVMKDSLFNKRVDVMKSAYGINIDKDTKNLLIRKCIKMAFGEEDNEGVLSRAYACFHGELNRIILNEINNNPSIVVNVSK